MFMATYIYLYRTVAS